METDRGRSDKLKCAIIDTNILMYVFLKKIDVISQLYEFGFKRIIIPRCVIEELEKLAKSLTGKERLAAKFALKLIEGCDFEILECERKSDDSLLELAAIHNCYLITNDKVLKRRAKEIGIPVGYIKEMNRLEITDEV